MTKYKGFQKIITGCEDCPNYDVRSKGRYCVARIPIKELPAPDKDFHIDFPDWCPLDDVDI